MMRRTGTDAPKRMDSHADMGAMPTHQIVLGPIIAAVVVAALAALADAAANRLRASHESAAGLPTPAASAEKPADSNTADSAEPVGPAPKHRSHGSLDTIARSGPDSGRNPHVPGIRRSGGGSSSPLRMRALFSAIAQVEGNDVRQVGDKGRSRGLYQIRRDYWNEACQFGNVVWDYETLVWSVPHCQTVMTWYWARYNARTDEERARMHNGGPNWSTGERKPRTADYWARVRALLQDAREGDAVATVGGKPQ